MCSDRPYTETVETRRRNNALYKYVGDGCDTK